MAIIAMPSWLLVFPHSVPSPPPPPLLRLLFFFLAAAVAATCNCRGSVVLAASSSSIGINYGRIANNLPSPENVVPLVQSIGATRVKLYDADPRVLRAFANTGVQFIVGIGNEYLPSISRDPKLAQDWVRTNVQAHLPATTIICIAVGNEVLTFNDTSLSSSLLPAMQNLHAALVGLSLDKQVAVTTAHSLAVLETSYPPSAGAFRRDLAGYLTQILNFHSKTGSPFLINAYPYFAYKSDPKHVTLDFVLFQPNQGVVDPGSGLRYDNMLFSQIDAVYSALASLGFRRLPVHISETGWPSKGDEDEAGATPENARRYNGNLMRLLSSDRSKGTPMRPDSDINIYVFALFNENMKPGPTSERNYGLFKPDGSPAYQLQLSLPGIQPPVAAGRNTSSGGGIVVSGSTSTPSQNENPSSSVPTGSSSTGYLSISSQACGLLQARRAYVGLAFSYQMAMLLLVLLRLLVLV